MVCVGAFSTLMEGIFSIQYQDAFKRSAFDISLQWSSLSRLFLIASMIYSLKDAAERDRLDGSTFIRMNVLIGCWSLAIGFAQGLRGFWIEMVAFSFPFFIRAYRSRLEKRKKESAF